METADLFRKKGLTLTEMRAVMASEVIFQISTLSFLRVFFCDSFLYKFYYHVLILIELYFSNFSYFSNFRPFTCFSVMIPEVV